MSHGHRHRRSTLGLYRLSHTHRHKCSLPPLDPHAFDLI